MTKPETKLKPAASCYALLTFYLVVAGGGGGGSPAAATRPPQNHLSEYNSLVSSSSFGEPVFRLEPPSRLNFYNSRGATLVCLASGSPKPTVSWYTSPVSFGDGPLSHLQALNSQQQQATNEQQSKPVTNVTNLREVLQNGRVIRFHPFKAEDFKPEIHLAEYRCVASNPVATIHSQSALVQAQVLSELDQLQLEQTGGDDNEQEAPTTAQDAQQTPTANANYLLRVSDEFVQLNSPVVLRCKFIPSADEQLQRKQQFDHSPSNNEPPVGLARQRQQVEWFTSDGLEFSPSVALDKSFADHLASQSSQSAAKGHPLARLPTSSGSKFVAFKTGELHLDWVEMADLRRTYGCRVRNLATKRIVAQSVGTAQLILTTTTTSSGANEFQPDAAQQPLVLHSIDQLVDLDSAAALHQSVDFPAGEQMFDQHHNQPQHQKYYFSTVSPSAKSSNNQKSTARPNRIIQLPCAVRLPQSQLSAGRWFITPTTTTTTRRLEQHDRQNNEQLPVELEEWAARNSLAYFSWTHQPSGNRTKTGDSFAHFRARQHHQFSVPATRIFVFPTFLAIEWPRWHLSGRFKFQLPARSLSGMQEAGEWKTVCDINVIVRQPIRLEMRTKTSGRGADGQAVQLAALRSTDELERTTSWLEDLFQLHTSPRKGRQVQSPQSGSSDGASPLIDNQPGRIQVRASYGDEDAANSGRVAKLPQVKLAQVGDRLELSCSVATGFPVDSIRWFKGGQLIQPQSSSDYFQYEIQNHFGGGGGSRGDQDQAQEEDDDQGATGSRLLVKQLQPAELGLQMFECFAQNFHADRARVQQLVLVVEPKELEFVQRRSEQALVQCPSGALLWLTGNQTTSGEDPAELMGSGGSHDELDEDADALGALNQQEKKSFLGTFQAVSDQDNRQPSYAVAQYLFRRQNPIETEFLVESEQVELVCPLAATAAAAAQPGGEQTTKKAQSIEWFKWSFAQKQQTTTTTTNNNVATATGNKMAQFAARQFNQLFGGGGGGDSRLVINGSSLQIKALARNSDEAVYVCRRNYVHVGQHPDQAGPAGGEPANELRLLPFDDANAAAVHQSSLATLTGGATSNEQRARFASSSSCQMDGAGDANEQQQQRQQAQVSSIRIRIVSKPKIDPFEFSKNLEEGMRSVIVCAVISGQSPIEINWFKDGELLVLPGENSDLTVDQSNGFSSTLTFHRIHPKHSGFYTCVASNSFASTNHTSRLLVNVAPYFLEPPKSQRTYLNSNILINCRAAGQPSPQIRWRKLVPIRNSSSSSSSSSAALNLFNQKQVAPLGSGGQLVAGQPATLSPIRSSKAAQLLSGNNFDLTPNELSYLDGSYGQQQMAQQQQPSTKYEFRIITSNSHIQVLENGSMIIKDVELADQSRYACQAINGINPSLSEVIDLQVLSPAQFDVNYETVSVKRDSMIKFNCLPRGDQPIRLQWFKEGNQLIPATTTSDDDDQQHRQQSPATRYSEMVRFYSKQPAAANYSATTSISEQQQRHNNLILTNGNHLKQHQKLQTQTFDEQQQKLFEASTGTGMISSELIISYADRADSGTFVCLAENGYGRDELTYKLIVQEQPDSPASISVDQIQSNQLKLSWSNGFDGNLPILSYVIEFRRLSSLFNSPLTTSNVAQSGDLKPANEWSRLVVGSAQTTTTATSMAEPATKPQGQQQSVVLKQLQAKSFYQIRLAATNSIGQSEFSPIQTIQTAEEPPNQRPNDLRVQPISSSSIKVMWRSPILADEQAPIRGYYVSYRQLLADQHQQQGGGLAGANSNKTSATGSTAWISLSSLNPNNSIDLMQTNNNNNYEFLVGQLHKNTKYEIRVQPFNSMGIGPASETIGQTLKIDRPRQPQLRLIAARKQSFELKWSFPHRHSGAVAAATTTTAADDEGDQHLGFFLFYKCEYDDWQEIRLESSIYHYKIENLRCGNKYQIYLSAFNAVGRSDPSDVLNVRTEGTAPVAPDSARLIARVNQTEAQLDLAGWQSGGCPISSFMIQFKRLHDAKWFVLSEGSQSFVQSTQEKILIPELKPATWYKLLVTATNEAGSTNAEYLFGTLTQSGEQLKPTGDIENFLINGQQQTNLVNYNRDSQQQLSGAGGSGILRSLSQLFSNSNYNNGNNQDQARLLLPISCVLLLLVTTLASYLYYSRTPGGTSSNNDRQPHKKPREANNKNPTRMGNQNLHYLNQQQQQATNLLMMDKLNLIGNQDNQLKMLNGGGHHQANCGHQLHQHHQLIGGGGGSSNCASGTATTTTTTNETSSGASSEISGHSAAALNSNFAYGNANLQLAADNNQPAMSLDNSSPFNQQQQYVSHPNNGSLVTSSMIDSLLDQQHQQLASDNNLGTISQLADGNIVYQPPSSSMVASNRQQQQQQKLANNLQATANSSSVSTHSTSCFDGHSGSSFSGHHVQLTNPIAEEQTNESSFMATPRHVLYSPAHYHKNVGLIVNQQQDHQLYATTTTTGGNPHNRLISSNSFASAADLLQRHQQLLMAHNGDNCGDGDDNLATANNEPIYQRLDRFKQLCNLSTCKQQQQQQHQQQFATLNLSSKAHLVRQYNQFHHQQQQPFAAAAGGSCDNQSANFEHPSQFSKSIQRQASLGNQNNEQQQTDPGQLMNNDTDFAQNLFFAPQPPPPLNEPLN